MVTDAVADRASSLPAIYYACAMPVRAGGELVNHQHVAALRRLGLRAFALIDPAARVAVPSRPYSVPLVTWTPRMRLGPEDWLVLPETTPPETFGPLAALPCRKVVHNQNPYYIFRGFPGIAAMNAYGLAGGIVCSEFTRRTLVRWGSATDWQVVRPPLLSMFRDDRPKRRQIAFMPRKRPGEARIVQGMLAGLHPDLADVPWVEIAEMSRRQVAEAMANSLVFASLSRLEGLGLPPLEAMASGCLVCGYDGGGGAEYATSENGLWVADGDVEGFAEALATALRLDPAAAAARKAAGRTTAAAFSQARFDAELERAWRHLLGDAWGRFRRTDADDAAAADDTDAEVAP